MRLCNMNSLHLHEEHSNVDAPFSYRKGENMSAIKHHDTAKHQRWQDAVLRHDKYFCQEYARYGRRTQAGFPVPATIAHHIQPVKEPPELRLDVNNGKALCAACFNARHPEKKEVKGDPPLMT